jgi:hypothetical protein
VAIRQQEVIKMAWLAQSIGLGQSGAANSLGIATPQPGSGVFAGPPTSAQGGAAAAGAAAPSLPNGISSSQAQQVAYWTSQGVDPSTALAMAMMQPQTPSMGSAVGMGVAGAGVAASDVLKAKLEPKLAEEAPATKISVQPSGPLPIAQAPSPMPATTTASMIAALL